MELIKEAVIKARAALERNEPQAQANGTSALSPPASSRLPPTPRPAAPPWSPPPVAPDPTHLERNRIVSLAAKDPSHVAFNLLRTKVYRTLTDNGWRSLAITSPTGGCGKTMIAINLAFSLARQANCRTVLIDLDLKKRAIAKTVGATSKASISEHLRGAANFEDCFVQVAENLILGLNHRSEANSAELLHDEQIAGMLKQVHDKLRPDVVVFDLPPMLASDDALAFMPRVDCALLIVGAGTTTPADVDQCQGQLSAATNLIGVVLNKVETKSEKYYYGPEA